MIQNPYSGIQTVYDFARLLLNNTSIDVKDFFIQANYDNQIIFKYKNILLDYYDYFKEELETIDLEKQYHYQPALLSEKLYGTPDLDFAILFFAGITNVKDFDRPKIKVLPASKVGDLIKIKSIANQRVKESLTNPQVYVAEPLLQEADGYLKQK